MGHGKCTFKEADVKRAVKAVAAAGQPVQGVRFDKDGFTVMIGEPVKANGTTDAKNEWDEDDDGA